MPLKRRDVEAALERKGFERREGAHSLFTYHTVRGTETRVRTMISHGKRSADIRPSTASLMARQCYLSNRQFRRLVDCSLSRRDYERELLAKRIIEP